MSNRVEFEKHRVLNKLEKLSAAIAEGNANNEMWRDYHHVQSQYHALRLKEYQKKVDESKPKRRRHYGTD